MAPDNLREGTVLHREWEKSELDLDREGLHPSFFFDELRSEAVDFLAHLKESHDLPRSQVARARTAVAELIHNAESHMHAPFYCSVLVGLREDGTLLAAVENAAHELSVSTAMDNLEKALVAMRTTPEARLALRQELLSRNQEGGLGIWNIVTQLHCDLWMSFDESINSVESFCIISPEPRRPA